MFHKELKTLITSAKGRANMKIAHIHPGNALSVVYPQRRGILSEPSSNLSGSSTPSANTGVKKGLPSVGLPVAETSAAKLWDVARRGMTSKDAYAKQLGWNSTSGNHWTTRVALLRGFKLVEISGDKIGLSELGQKVVNTSSPESQMEARRTALLSLKAYRDLVASFDGTAIPALSTLASRLQFDYGKSPEIALKAAQAFIDSLRHAEMIDDQDVVRVAGVGMVSVTPPEPLITNPDEDVETAELERAFAVEDEEAAVGTDVAEEEISFDEELRQIDFVPDGTGSQSVSISVTLDLSKYRADEVIDILRALKGF